MKKLKKLLVAFTLAATALSTTACGLNPSKLHDGIVCGLYGDRCPMTQDDVAALEASIAALEAYIEQMRDQVAADLSGVYDALNQVVVRTNSSVAEIIDLGQPGGEVIFRMNNGQFIAWYKNLGLYALEEGVMYQTTDSEKLRFIIENGVINVL